ncbi:transcription initiation factor IIE [Tepidibacter mesophilus]|uniref:transcription initiation factor IIE n=1 Tax=Tepidibacter mesophilus TaxID=655607 RepID=UPI000C08320E|nr:transcription initiation factor IIE [Tepidibacter mesophilus]
MKYQEKYIGSKQDLYAFLKENYSKLMKEILEIEGEKVVLPGDKELVYKVKYENNEVEGSYSVKISWANQEEFEEFEEEEEEIDF